MFIRLQGIVIFFIVTAVTFYCQVLGATIEPAWIHNTGETMLASITFADFDLDSIGDVIAMGSYGTIFVWDIQGNTLTGWPVSYSENTPATPAIGDVDGDGDMELIVGSWHHLYVYNHDGTQYPGWPRSYGTFSSSTLEDLDSDGDMEIIYPGKGSVLYVFEADGSNFPGFPVTIPDSSPNYIGACSVADIDGDGFCEIVAGLNRPAPSANPSKVYVWKSDGSILSGFPVYTCGTVEAPVIGDLDGDGTKEIIAGAYCNGEHDSVYVWNNEGVLEPGWPVEAQACLRSTPSLGDLDLDGDLEILIGGMDWVSWRGQVYAFHHDGTPVQNWPVSVGTGGNITSSPIIADIDGDTSQVEVIFKGADTIYAFHADGTQVNGFPYFLDDQSMTPPKPTPAVGDLDSDGDIEMAFASVAGEIHFFDEPEQCFPDIMLWTMYRHDCRNTGFYYSKNTGIKSSGKIGKSSSIKLSCNPNPFSKTTVISFQCPLISEKEKITLSIYDLSGRLVESFRFTTDHLAPSTAVIWDGRDDSGKKLSSGVYFLRFETGEVSLTKKLLLLR
ncbi:MAG TPA: T9SS type A sorting domain-containing protein [candidate division WOR-3 bacterium]|uniref:T9SS type A sorting domain-containing protein n=1 Tax=candidate division WOR-3 bacterium TaxID=2052148 RepID=A0A9C9EKY0_UNCW3|nr:T9SS type A sorting domain-containing protein [candidate division WOR-3 bacterium]